VYIWKIIPITMKYFDIIQALCRSALNNASSATIHQVERLIESMKKDGNPKEAKSLEVLLRGANKALEMSPSKIQRSFVLSGEELTPQTPIPVDKEFSTPLAQIIFPKDLTIQPLIFNKNIAEAINSILDEWKNFDKLLQIEARPSRSCLIFGEPGTGKTHLALWIAKQLDIPVVMARLDGIMSSFLGTSSRNIGNLFSFVNKYRCILLLDEFDAIAKLRDDPQEVGEIKRVVNTLLQNLDVRSINGFTIGITNHEKLLDPAIWRRFEVQIEIPKPSTEVRMQLMEYFLGNLNLETEKIKFLAWALEGASGADIQMLSHWLKKSHVLDSEISLLDQARKFAALNSGRINTEKRNLLLSSDDNLISALLSDPIYSFKQKDVASIMGVTSSKISKSLSKI
jgi:chromosomal replication initiation ATPase DnaA